MCPNSLPETQHAVLLVGPDELRHDKQRRVFSPGPHQVLARVEAVGLCFSDLKLLKQFSHHVRKSEVVKGLASDVLQEIPSYVPGDNPTIPGHEVVCRIVAVGDRVRHHHLGERCLVQTDYRDLRTASSNAAFGYNFEGGLQEYVLMDERVIIQPGTGERFLIPVDDTLGASAVALVEPWACVENSYVNPERRAPKPGGRLLVVATEGHQVEGLAEALIQGNPASLTALCAGPQQLQTIRLPGVSPVQAGGIESLPDEHFDDIICFSNHRPTIEALNSKLAARGIINVVTGGRRVGEAVSVGIGRVHYGMTRWIGTHTTRPVESYTVIPATGEIRAGEKIAVIGAGGPMGQMHVIRNLALGLPGVSLVATDIDDGRLNSLMKKAGPLARERGVALRSCNTKTEPLNERFSYFALLVPAGVLAAEAIGKSLEGCLINVFAGIPAPTLQAMDLDTYIANRCFMFGTSGSLIRDMKIVLAKVLEGRLDTNCSVDAISGMAGAVEGMAAVKNRTLAGKIIVYPFLHDVGLIPLAELASHYPTVSEKLDQGQWTKAAEEELIRVAAGT